MIDVSQYILKLEWLKEWVNSQVDMRYHKIWTLDMFKETGYMINIRRWPRFDTFQDLINNKQLKHN